VSRTDPDCAIATNRRGHFSEPTYKTHMAADSKARIIVDISVTPRDQNEGNELIDQIDRITYRNGRPPSIVTAYAGYTYGRVYGALESRGIEPMIPVKAEPKPRKVIALRRFKYDEANQVI
jgi:hypothetical protein